MKLFSRMALLCALIIGPLLAQSQTYCEPGMIGVGWCDYAWAVDDITIGSFSELNSGCGAGGKYTKQLGTSITITKGAQTAFTLGSGGLVQWGIWIDLNADGDFTDATDYFWGSSSSSVTVSGSIIIPASTVPTSTRIRIRSGNQGLAFTQSDACDWGFQTETQDFTLVMNPPGGCNVPTNLSATTTSTTAALTWDNVGAAYNVEHGQSGYTQGGGTTQAATTNSANLTNLTPDTYYDFYVQNDCSNSTGDSSSWNGPYTFRTQCETITTFPYIENFDDSPWAPNTGSNYQNDTISTCWIQTPVFNYGFTWLVRTASTPSSSTGPSSDYSGIGNYMYTETFGSAGDEAYFTSPQFNTSTLTAPWLSFQYFMFGDEMGDLYTQVSINGGQNWTTVDSIKGQQQMSTTSSWLERGLDLTAYKSTAFMFRFKGVQGQGYSKSDMAVDFITLGEAPACQKASALTITNITGSTAQVNWVNNSPTYYIELGPQGFTQGTGNKIDTVNASGTHTFTNLAGNTYFDLYIKTDCSNSGNGTSSWSGPFTFRTLLRPDWEEDFNVNGFRPNNRWEEAKGLIANPTIFTSTSSTWAHDGWLNNGNTGAIRSIFNTYSSDLKEWFFTEQIDLGSNTAWELYFNIAATVNASSASTTLQADDKVSVVISTDGGLTWNKSNTLLTITQANNLSNTGSIYTADLTGYSGIVKIGFYFESTVPNIANIDLFVDNIGMRQPAACPAPTGINAWNISATDMVLGWTGNAVASTYKVEYGPAGFTQGTGTLITGITNDSTSISNLDPVTQYDFYVMSNCGSDTSLVTGPLTILTDCPAVFSTPYHTDFDFLSKGDVPVSGKWDNCWVSSNPVGYKYRFKAGNGVTSSKGTGPTADHTTGIAEQGNYMFADAVSTGLDATLSNGPFDLSTLTTPTLSFWYFMYGADMGELHVDISSDNSTWQEDMFVVIGEQQTSSNSPWTKVNIALNQYLNDSIYIRFRTIKGSSSKSEIAIDDVSIKNAVGCITPSGLTAVNITGTSADLSWASYSTPHTIEWGQEGFTQGTGVGTTVTGVSATTLSLTGLTPNTGYDFYIKDTCNSNSWIGPHTFYTTCNGPLAGNYTVGGASSNDFSTLKEALRSLENCGISASVTINLSGGNNGKNLSLGTIPGASASNIVTIQGTGTDTIYGNGQNFALELNAAAFVKFSNITFDNHNGIQVIWLHNNTHHIVIDSSIVLGRSLGGSIYNTANIAGSLLPNNSSTHGNNAHHITISNNTIDGGYCGIAFFGNDPTHTLGYVIKNNTIINIDTYGIRLDQTDSVMVEGNYMNDSKNQYSGHGLSLNKGDHFVINNNYFAGKSAGVTVTSGNQNSISQNSSIINNMLIGLGNGDGLKLTNTNNVNLYFNSLLGSSDALELNLYSSGDYFNFRNNIFYAKTGFAINNDSYSGNNFVLDYNIYYTEGMNFVKVNGSSHTDLAAWKTASTSLNGSSIQGNPQFNSATDLHIIGVLPNDVGVAISGVSTDYDGDTRPFSGATSVDIGADEFTPKSIDAAVTQIIDPNSGCGDSTTSVSLRIRNLGTTTITSLPIVVEFSGDITSTLNYTFTGSLASLSSTVVSVGTVNTYNGATNLVIKAYTSIASDEDYNNDTLTKTSTYFLPQSPQFYEPDTVCYDAAATTVLRAANYYGVNYAWYSNLTDTVPYSINDSITVPISGQPHWYLSYGDDVQDSLKTMNFVAQYGGSGGAMFNLTAKSNLVVDSFDLNSRANIGDTAELVVYYIPYGSYIGNETNQNPWTIHDTVKFVSQGTNNRSKAVLNTPLNIPTGAKYAIYLEYNAATEHSIYPLTVINSNLMTLEGGAGLYGSFSTAYQQEIFDGIIHAHSISCSDTRVEVALNINTDTAIANFTTIVSQPNKVDVDASASQGQLVTWDFGDGTTATGLISAHNYTNGGNYTITCAVTDTVCNTIDTATFLAAMTIGLEENPLANSLKVFPNPNQGIFQISFELASKSNVNISVFTVTGKEIFESQLLNIHQLEQYKLDISNHPNGIYFVRISTDQNTSVSKITKM